MENDLEILSDMITTIHKGIDDKSQMISTQVVDSAFRHTLSQARLHLDDQEEDCLVYITTHLDIAIKLDVVIEMTLKHLNKMTPLNPFDFYRLMRCRRIENGLTDLIAFYAEQKTMLKNVSG